MARRGRFPLREVLQQLDNGMDSLMAEGSDDDLGMDTDDEEYNYDSDDGAVAGIIYSTIIYYTESIVLLLHRNGRHGYRLACPMSSCIILVYNNVVHK